MTFPGLTPAETTTLTNPPIPAPTASAEYTCPPGNSSVTQYNNNPGYLILPFQSDYRISDNSGLNTGTNGSSLLKAVGATTNGNLPGYRY